MELIELYDIAEESNIEIDNFPLATTAAVSEMDSDLSCHIAIDYTKLHTQAEERVVLAHEIGHCVTGSFYNRYSPFDVREKHEYRADRYAALKAVPPDELVAAIADGYENVWELSEYFGITEDFMRRVIEIYIRTLGDGFWRKEG